MGALVDLDVPRSFWSRLAGKYGNMFYWKEKVKLHHRSLVAIFSMTLHCADFVRKEYECIY